MILKSIEELFEVKYGVNLELVNLTECSKNDKGAINFVSRTENNNGISAYVLKEEDVEPNPPMTLSVAGGGSVLSTFLQQKEYYSGRDLYVLIPKRKYSTIELLFYAYCIRQNKYRYNYGRQANKTLKDILIPIKMPTSWEDILSKPITKLRKESVNGKILELHKENWKWFNLIDYFEISSSRDELINDLTLGGKTPYITSSENNNGITSFVKEEPTNKAKTITANRGGSVGYFFYQPQAYKATPVDVRILTPKFKINTFIGIFLINVLRLEKYKFNYSRKMGSDRLKEFKIKLPHKANEPDWEFMEEYIKSLPYSANLK